MTVQTTTETSLGRESVACHLCAGHQAELYFEGRGFAVVQCADCGLYYVNPQPGEQELEGIYATFDSGDQWREGEEHFNRAVCRTIRRFKRSGAALDVGSGSGNFLRAMRKAGFSTCGVEPSKTGSTYAREYHDIETFNGSIEQFLSSGTERQFDVVSLLNVLEHLKDPAGVLRRLRDSLLPTGLLAVVVPDARLHIVIGEIRKRLGATDPFWMNTRRHPLVGFDPPIHLCSFEPGTVARLIERCGFHILRVRNAPVVFNEAGWKNAAKLAARAFSEVLYRATFGRVVFGYSTLVIARKG